MEISLEAEKIFQIGSFPITNTLLASWFAMMVLILIAFMIRLKLNIIPTGVQNIVEAILEPFWKITKEIIGDIKQTRLVFSFVFTLFVFILVCNLMGLLPGFGSIGHPPVFRSANSDLNATLAWAVISVLGTQVIGILAAGFFKYSKRFINFKKGPIYFFVGLLELFLEMTKMISFSFRLFGNVFAGEVLLTVIAFLIPYLAPLPFYGLEVFVGFVQALIFAMLTLIFIKVAIIAGEEH